MRREATISADGLYRFDLTRSVQLGCTCARCFQHYTQWRTTSVAAGFVLFVLCNPSTADAETDDATERRGWGFANSWGFGKFVFVNTNPFRATDAAKMRVHNLPPSIRSTNEKHIFTLAKEAARVVCAWGKSVVPRDAELCRSILKETHRPVHVLKLAKDGTPWHPLYLPNATQPQFWDLSK